jgi:hypothetical protein
MTSIVKYLAVVIVLATLVLAAALGVRHWLRRVRSVAIEGGAVVVETSSDGRLANPYRENYYIPLAIAAPLGFVVVVIVAAAFTAIGVALVWVFSKL